MDTVDLSTAVDVIQTAYKNIDKDIDFDSVITAFRYLRNLCGTSRQAQNEILQESSSLLIASKTILYSTLCSGDLSQEKLLCTLIGLQFLCNLVVGNEKNQEQVWSACQDLIDVCLKFEDAKVQSFSSRIIYNIFLGKPEFLNDLKHPFEDLIELTLKEHSSAIAELTLEIFILKSDYVSKFYEKIKPENRLLILEIVKNLITDNSDKTLQPEIVKFFSSQFMKKSDLILKTCETYTDLLDPVEVVKILDLLIAFSSDDQNIYLEILQKEVSLLINCIMLLKNIHLISKENGNNFSMMTKISQVSGIENDKSVQEHPAFGFKCSLIRLIGNFCWKNKNNQNKVRELECIPVLLDCCNIDARNPFIIQWCILAICNICEKNSENQQVIASLSREGKIDSARLQELGINLNTDSNGDSLYIAPWK